MCTLSIICIRPAICLWFRRKQLNEWNSKENYQLICNNKRNTKYKDLHDQLLIYVNLKTAKDSAAVGDGANRAGKSKKADAGKDVAVDELPGDGGDDDNDGSDDDVHI